MGGPKVEGNIQRGILFFRFFSNGASSSLGGNAGHSCSPANLAVTSFGGVLCPVFGWYGPHDVDNAVFASYSDVH